MALPKIEYPLHEIYVKSLDRKIKFRPFLVKEEKLLLIAKESKEIDDIKMSLRQVITNCSAEEFDVDSLPIFDIEMIFLKLRARSVGESVKLVFNCQNVVEGNICNADTDYTLDLEKIIYEEPEGHNPTVMLTDKIGLRLKYPSLDMDVTMDENAPAYVTIMMTLISNIDYIFDEESVYKTEDITKEELLEYLGGITIDKMAEIKNFFKTSPKVVLKDEVPCVKCGHIHKIRNEDLLGFFI